MADPTVDIDQIQRSSKQQERENAKTTKVPAEVPAYDQTEVVRDPESEEAVQIPEHPAVSGRVENPLDQLSPNDAYREDPDAFGADEAPEPQTDHEGKPVTGGQGDSN